MSGEPGGAGLVLPVTSRGIPVTDRFCWAVLAVAMAAAAALILYLNRGTVFFLDELAFLYATPDLSGAGDILEPHNGHLIATTRLVYKAVLETAGVQYEAFRALALATLLLSAGLLYALVKRRIGAVAALAPVLVLLFLGSAWQHVLVPVGFTVTCSVAAGLASLLALERGDRRGDVLACLLLMISVVTYTTGLAFAVGAAVAVLMRPDRRRRVWIFLAPLLLYAAWWLWSLGGGGSSDEQTSLVNLLLLPSYVVDSLAAVTAALLGLGYDFDQPGPFLELGWGRVVAVVAVVAVALRLRRRRPEALLWVGLGVALAYWSLGALAADQPDRAPWAVRYMYTGAVALLLAAAGAAAGARLTRTGLTVVFGITAVSLVTNVALLREAGRNFRDYSAHVRADLAMAELARDRIDPAFDPLANVPALATTPSTAGEYLAVVDRYGSVAISPQELAGQPGPVRHQADRVLVDALRLATRPRSGGPSPRSCLRVAASSPGVPVEFGLPPGGGAISIDATATVPLAVGRFADTPSVEVGSVPPEGTTTIAIPPDSSPQPWRGSVAARSARVCELR